MIRLGSPGDPVAGWPVEAVRMHLPGSGWAGAFLEAAAKCKAIVIGPGLGTDEETADEIRAVVAAAPVPVVIDADALTALGDKASARTLLDKRIAPSILTPHDGEYARIAGAPPGPDRLAAARALAESTGAIVLLKGPLTAVAAPGAGGSTSAGAARPDVLLSVAGVPALATAGSGDVLSGVIGAFCARGEAAHRAAELGAHAHGRAAALGPVEGLVAGDLPELVGRVLSDVLPRGCV